jgi:UDP-glucose 4-epimerase
MASRKILVCGGAGFIGSHLVERFMAEGHEVDVVDDLSTGSLANLADSRNASGRFKFQNISVQSSEFAELIALKRPDIIVNLAVFTPSHAHSAGALASLGATVSVLEAARLGGVSKVVTALPAALLYGECLARDLPIKEGHISDPRTSEEVFARAASDIHAVYRDRHGVEYTVLAMANVYGQRQRPEDGVVAAFVDALEHGGLVINVGTGVTTSILDLWSIMGGASSPVPRTASARPNDIVRLALSPVRARIQLGWSPFTLLKDGLASMRSQ